MKWIIRINSSDGPRYYGPFANAGAANAWIKALEREGDYTRSWSLLPVLKP